MARVVRVVREVRSMVRSEGGSGAGGGGHHSTLRLPLTGRVRGGVRGRCFSLVLVYFTVLYKHINTGLNIYRFSIFFFSFGTSILQYTLEEGTLQVVYLTSESVWPEISPSQP